MQLSLPIPRHVRRLAEAIAEAGGRAYVVGGSVRDHLLDKPVKDLDIEVHGLDLDALERALRRLGRVDAVGRSFGVFKLSLRGEELDISVPRRDSKVGPGHTGIAVEGDPFMGLEEAVRRRDLTVNALMVDILTGELHDLVGGLDDLRAERLRAVDTETFLEDPLRALRVVQFAARFDFEPDDDLHALCVRASVDELPAERLLGEWVKLLLRGERPSRGLAFARSTRLTARLFPERVDDPELDAALDRFAAAPPQDPPRRLATGMLVWLARTPVAGAEDTLLRLGLHRFGGFHVQRRVLEALPELATTPTDDPGLRHLSTRCELELLLDAQAALRPGDARIPTARQRAAELGILNDKPAPLVQGRDLITLGVRPGPSMGRTLKALYTRQLDGELTTREEGLDAARRLLEAADPD